MGRARRLSGRGPENEEHGGKKGKVEELEEVEKENPSPKITRRGRRSRPRPRPPSPLGCKQLQRVQ